jgi:hypothetical protein
MRGRRLVEQLGELPESFAIYAEKYLIQHDGLRPVAGSLKHEVRAVRTA